MNCEEARAKAIEKAWSGLDAADPHFAACAECGVFLRGQLALGSALAVVAREVPDAPDLEAKLLAEFDAAARPVARRFRLWMPAFAGLAALLAVGVVVIHRPVAAPAITAEPFIEIPYIAPLAPYERTNIVRMDVPVSALIAAGFDVHSPDTGAAFAADVLFGQDGRAHAIRLISNSNRRVIQ
jgi:hypothetical protein